jgi:hypothetical protein
VHVLSFPFVFHQQRHVIKFLLITRCDRLCVNSPFTWFSIAQSYVRCSRVDDAVTLAARSVRWLQPRLDKVVDFVRIRYSLYLLYICASIVEFVNSSMRAASYLKHNRSYQFQSNFN